MGTDGGFQGREGGQRDGSEGKGEDQSGGIRLYLLGSIAGLCSVLRSSIPAVVSWERSRSRWLPSPT